MTANERARASRENRLKPIAGSGYACGGKHLTLMLSPHAHTALKVLSAFYGDITQKEIIEKSLVTLAKEAWLRSPLASCEEDS
ncbi:MAG: hypothetical protein AB7C98_00600 [Acidithiobacillus sp.]